MAPGVGGSRCPARPRRGLVCFWLRCSGGTRQRAPVPGVVGSGVLSSWLASEEEIWDQSCPFVGQKGAPAMLLKALVVPKRQQPSALLRTPASYGLPGEDTTQCSQARGRGQGHPSSAKPPTFTCCTFSTGRSCPIPGAPGALAEGLGTGEAWELRGGEVPARSRWEGSTGRALHVPFMTRARCRRLRLPAAPRGSRQGVLLPARALRPLLRQAQPEVSAVDAQIYLPAETGDI